MKRVIAIFFLFLFAVSFTELGQLVKVPALVQHFYSHQQSGSTSFIAYLFAHYTSHGDDGDNKEDMQLPFKTTISTPSLVAGVPTNGPQVIKSIRIIREIKSVPQISFIPTIPVFSIFHPPRTVAI